MYDIGAFRADLESIAARLAARGNYHLPVEQFRDLDARRRAAIQEAEELKAHRNAASTKIARQRKEGQDTTAAQAEVRAMGDRIALLDKEAAVLEDEFRLQLAGIPNLPQSSVPTGKDASDNVEVRRWGAPREFSFTPQSHWDLGPALGMLDFERAAKVTGARFAFYLGLGARLERALTGFMLDVHTREHGYTEMLAPFVVNSASLYGTGNLPKFGEDLFKLEHSDYWLIPTAEVPVTNYFRDETLDAAQLPISFCAATSCFRSEAGSYGRDVRGIIRQHQFQKVELVKFTTPEESNAGHEKLTADAEDILRRLGLPFRTVVLCTGDMGFSSSKTYDIEVWLPGQNAYKEISSCSNFEAFQARRANIRCKAPAAKRSEHLHTINGSGLAVGRTWVAIVENYQQEDGSVLVPEVLRPYMGTDRITSQSA